MWLRPGLLRVLSHEDEIALRGRADRAKQACLVDCGAWAHHERGGTPMVEDGMGTTRTAVIRTIKDFLAEAHLSERRFGEEAVGDAKVLRRLRGGAGVSLATIERIETYIDARRPMKAA